MATKKTRIMYIESASGNARFGPARIGCVSFSKTGCTLYYRGYVFQSCKGSGNGGNYIDVTTGDLYWISGPKRNGHDRHWARGGPVKIDPDVADAYWREIRSVKPHRNPLVA